jgi:CubicO group peptidase (beta-lactamase class C family)
MTARRVSLVWCVLALGAPAAAPAQPFERVRAKVRQELVESGVPSIAVAVARRGKIVWEEGFGWADRENRRPATAHTMYSLASISKPMTATGVMRLVESEKIRLDAPINDYLGRAKLTGYAGDAAQATVRRVANHSAGLPLHVNFFYSDEPHRPPDMSETVRRYGILVTPPGEEYRYSNIGYGVLDYLISRVSERSYEDFMREEIFLPLGMTRASVGVGLGLEPYQAVRYGRTGLPIPFYDFDHRGASAVYASAHDLARFGMFHLKAHLPDQKAILSDALIDEMQKPTVATGKTSGYGVGWMTSERNGYRVVSHGGAMGGVRNLILMVPEEGIVVVVLTNLGNHEIPTRIAGEILAEMLPRWKRAPEPRTASAPAAFRPDAALTGAWKGRLVTHAGEHLFMMEVSGSGDVHVRLGKQMETLLNDARFENSRLTGRMYGDVGCEDTRRKPHEIRLSLKLRGAVLNGSATAISSAYNLTSWLELERQ